jgi:hypothetical protein
LAKRAGNSNCATFQFLYSGKSFNKTEKKLTGRLNTLKKIANDISNFSSDVRAEVLLAQVLESGLLQKEFSTQADGFFYRSHVKDLYKIYYNDQNAFSPYLSVHLSRSGLYDMLPEGLFFQPDDNAPTGKTGAEMAEDSRIDKKRESEIRKFFAPFEHAFFLQSLKNELRENEILQGLRSGWLREYFIDFWKLPPDIPAGAAMVLVMFLPYVHVIAGDTAATALLLQKIINEPVAISLGYSNTTGTDVSFNRLGEYELGSRLTCGESFREQYPVININIGPLQKSNGSDYIEGGLFFSMLQTFCNYFIPANADVNTVVLLRAAEEKFVLNQDLSMPILGMSSVI